MNYLRNITCAIFAALLLIAPPAQADVPDGTRVDPAIVRNLLSWVEQEMGVSTPTLPVVVASQKKFDMVMNFAGVHFADAKAAYIPGTVILDNKTWDPEDTVQISLLVHELAHHVQLFSKRKYACADAREYEAYVLQNRWLAAQGERPFASDAWIDRMSRCPGEGGMS